MMSDVVAIHTSNRSHQIGNICIQWAFLEYLLARAIWKTLDLDKQAGLIVTGALNIQGLSDTAIKLAEKIGQVDEILEALKVVRKSLHEFDVIRRRNSAVHGVQFGHPNRLDARIVEVYRGKKAGDAFEVEDSDLAKLGNDIEDIHKQLYVVLEKHGFVD